MSRSPRAALFFLVVTIFAFAVVPSIAYAATINANGKADVLKGTPKKDTIMAGGGNDTLYGDTGGDDCPRGAGSAATWRCKLDGGAGNDVIIDGAGSRRISGDEGDDTIYVGPGEDIVHGEEGADTIYATNDGERDEIYCGPLGDVAGNRLVYLDGGIDPLDLVRFWA